MKEVNAYLSHQLGFSETGRYVLGNLIKPRIAEIGIKILDPFVECEKKLDYQKRREAFQRDYKAMERFFINFSRTITPTNNKLMQKSDLQLALLDGGPAIDDGVASEIGYYAGLNHWRIKRGQKPKPIFALRSDSRCGENIGVSINPQVWGYILSSGGALVDGEGAVERWFAEIEKWYKSFRDG
ncbi:MAG: nucleoside 2-deoxyribosyltransferase [Candidatus Aenigmatarchaeota archaeon]